MVNENRRSFLRTLQHQSHCRLHIPLILGLILLSGCVSRPATAPSPEPSIPLPAAPVSTTVTLVSQATSEDAAWKIAKPSKEIEVLQAYLERFPNGSHSNSAKLRLNLLQRGAIH
jgi:hypothetical protein